MFSARVIVAALGFPACLVARLTGGGIAAAGEPFVRGDADASGQLEVTDGIRVLAHLFLEGSEAVRCQSSADVDDSGIVELTDAIRLLTYLFQQGPAPAAPFPFCGEDPTEDELGCEEYGTCVPVHDVFGIAVPADAVFIVIDRSGGMQANGALSLAKQEAEGDAHRPPHRSELRTLSASAEALADSAPLPRGPGGIPAESNGD